MLQMCVDCLHLYANFHYHMFKTFQPFINIGPGFYALNADGLFLNFDAGVQVVYEKFIGRLYHESANKLWGPRQYGSSYGMLSVGYQFDI